MGGHDARGVRHTSGVRASRFMRDCRPAQCRARAQTTSISPVPSSRPTPPCSAALERYPGKMGSGWTSIQCMRVVPADRRGGGSLGARTRRPSGSRSEPPHLPLPQTSPSQRMLFGPRSLRVAPLAQTPRSGSVSETGFRETSVGPATPREERHARQPLAPCRMRLIRRSSCARLSRWRRPELMIWCASGDCH